MDAKDEIKQRLAVEDVIGEYLELKRSGRNYKALSPFSAEKTPSFMVSPEKGIWHDFSSNQGGDIFSFVMLMEGIDFVDAIKLLAPKAGVDLSQFQSDGKTAKKKKRIQEALVLATRYYQQSLLKNKDALDYVVKKRGYGQEVIGNFQIGYSPSSGHALLDAMKKKGFKEQELKEAGLVTQGRDWRDMFRGRIMVPLHDGQGNPIGFTARVLDDGLPKYINTSQTLVYDKSRHVFGLHLAKDAIRKQNFVVLVEGNMDVIASHKAGVKNVVATAGTALTIYHLKQLNKLTEDIRLAFDQDDAGIKATERAIPIAQEAGVRLSIIDIVGGKDPDDLIKEDPKKWEEIIQQSVYVMDWIIDKYAKQLDLTGAEGKKAFTDKTLTVLGAIQDSVERQHYVKQIAKMIDVDSGSVQTKLENLSKNPSNARKKRIKQNLVKIAEESGEKYSAYQDMLLGINLLYPSAKDSLKHVKAEHFDGSKRQQLADFVLKGITNPVTKVPSDLQQIDDYVKIVLFKTEELYGDKPTTDVLIEAVNLSHRLARDYVKKRKNQLSKKIKVAEEANDARALEKLLSEFNTLLKEGK